MAAEDETPSIVMAGLDGLYYDSRNLETVLARAA
jgi:hypothetical protein